MTFINLCQVYQILSVYVFFLPLFDAFDELVIENNLWFVVEDFHELFHAFVGAADVRENLINNVGLGIFFWVRIQGVDLFLLNNFWFIEVLVILLGFFFIFFLSLGLFLINDFFFWENILPLYLFNFLAFYFNLLFLKFIHFFWWNNFLTKKLTIWGNVGVFQCKKGKLPLVEAVIFNFGWVLIDWWWMRLWIRRLGGIWEGVMVRNVGVGVTSMRMGKHWWRSK